MRRPLLLALSTLIAACDRSGSPQPAASASAAAAPKERVVCLDLPGAVRTALSADAGGKRLFYAERVFEGDRERFDFVSLDLATRRAEIVVRDVGDDPERAGDRVVFRRPAGVPERTAGFPDRDPEEPPRRLWSAPLRGGEPVPLSPEGARVLTFAVDAKSGVVYYAARDRNASRAVIWKVPAAGGSPEKIGEGGAVYAVADGGKSIVIKLYGDKSKLAKIPIAGGDPLWTADDGYNVSVTETHALVLAGGADQQKHVQATALADGKTAVAESTQAVDVPLVAGAPGYVSREDGERRALLRFDGGKLVPVITVSGGAVHAAAPLPEGQVAALVAIDTSGDGKVDTVIVEGSDDERDVCLLLPNAVGDEDPRVVQARTIPKRHLAALPRIKRLLDEKEPDFARGKLRFLRSGTILVIDVPGVGPTDLEALRDRLKQLQQALGEASGDPKLGLSIRFADSRRHATSLWSEERGRFATWIGVGDIVLADRAAATIEHNVDYPYRVRVETGPVRKVEADLSCAGKVKNLGTDPIDLEVECRAYSPFTFVKGPWTAERGPMKAPSLAPGASGAYEVKLPTLVDELARTSVRFFAGGKLVTAVDAKEQAHAKDWIEVVERLRADTGAAPIVDRPYVAPTFQLPGHRLAAFEEPPGFASAPPKKQEELARALWKAVSAHARKHDAFWVPTIALYDAKGARSFTVEDGKLVKP